MKKKVEKENLITALYCRLSVDDIPDADAMDSRRLKEELESNSITHQKQILEDYCKKNGIRNYLFFADDGISGTTFNRPDFKKMDKMIESGEIGTVIVKDLSRFGRDHVMSGYYLQIKYPSLGVNFISLQENVDIEKDMGTDMLPIHNVFNEWYAQQTSKKIRQVFDMKRRNGEHIGSFAAYGYVKDPNDKNALVVDEEAATVVRDIFNMFLDGMSKNAIVHSLNDHGILSPAAYKRERLGLKYQNPSVDPAKPSLWCAQSITTILKNRMYCGDMVQGRYRMKSYKVHVQEVVPEDEWYIVENTHEAIIDRETFEKVQRLLIRDTRTGPQQKKPYLFSGFLKCADCGKAMTRSKVGNVVYYYCRTYKDRSKTACTKHTIKHDRLEAAVLYAIQQQVYLAVDYTKTIERINRAPLVKSQSKKLMDAIEQKERELAKITRYKQAIYQDWKDGEISHSDYRHMKEDYERQAEALDEVIGKLRAEQAEQENGIDTENPFLTAFRQYQNIDKLTRDILIELVDHIKIHEGGYISIVFRFADELRRIQEFIEVNTHSEAV